MAVLGPEKALTWAGVSWRVENPSHGTLSVVFFCVLNWRYEQERDLDPGR